MKTKLLIGLIAISLVLISGCGQKLTCNQPYIQVGNECCLDQDSNSICDKDESQKSNTIETQYIKETKEILPNHMGVMIVGGGVADVNELWIDGGNRLVGAITSNEPVNILMSKMSWYCYSFGSKGFDKMATFDATGEQIYIKLLPAKIEKYNVLNYEFDIPWGNDGAPDEGSTYCLVIWRDEKKDTTVIVNVDVKGVKEK